MTDPQQAMAAELASLGPSWLMFVIRRAGCGCRVGAVHRTALAGYVVAGRRQGPMVDPRTKGVQRTRAWYLQSLEQPSRDVEPWACHHGEGPLPLADLLARARDTRASGPFVVEETSLLP